MQICGCVGLPANGASAKSPHSEIITRMALPAIHKFKRLNLILLGFDKGTIPLHV